VFSLINRPLRLKQALVIFSSAQAIHCCTNVVNLALKYWQVLNVTYIIHASQVIHLCTHAHAQNLLPRKGQNDFCLLDSRAAETQTGQSRHGAVKVFSGAQRNPEHSFALFSLQKQQRPCNIKHTAMLTGFAFSLCFF